MKAQRKNSSYFKKIFLSFLVLSVVISVLLTAFMASSYWRTSSKLLERFYNQILRQTNYSVTYTNDLAKRISSALYNDKSIVAFLNMDERDGMKTVQANVSLKKHTMPLTYVDSVYLYNANIDLLFSTKNGVQSTLADFYDTEIAGYISDLNRLKENGGRPVAHSVLLDGVSGEICSYILYETDRKSGKLSNVLVINIGTNTLTNSIAEIAGSAKSDALFVVADTDGTLIGAPSFYYSGNNKASIDNAVAEFLAMDSPKLTTVDLNGVPYLSLFSRDNVNSWMIVGLLRRSALMKDLVQTAVLSVAFTGLLLVGAAFVCRYLARRLNNPVAAITRMVQGEETEPELIEGMNLEEFSVIASVFSSMRKQNEQFEAYKNDTEASLRQDLLTSLVQGRNLLSIEKTQQLLNRLGIKFIAKHQLCLCILKIDNYKGFLENRNPQECWAYRYAIVNITNELLSKSFRCEVTDTNNDKFVVLVDCEKEKNYSEFVQRLQASLREVVEQLQSSLHLSMTGAYSSFFSGIERVSGIYQRTEDLVQLKIHCGNGQIIEPHMLEKSDSERLEVTRADEEELIERVLAAENEAAGQTLSEITRKLQTHTYPEIIPYAIHLDYLIYNAACGKFPILRDQLSENFLESVSSLSESELMDDIRSSIGGFIEDICRGMGQLRQSASGQNCPTIISRMLEIIDGNLSSKDLCLSGVAEQVGLSANYIGGLFRAAQGISVAKYISDKRMEKVAWYLKNTRYPLPKILDLVGLEMSNYFYTTFKKYFGMSMGKYKLTVLGQQDDAADQELEQEN